VTVRNRRGFLALITTGKRLIDSPLEEARERVEIKPDETFVTTNGNRQAETPGAASPKADAQNGRQTAGQIRVADAHGDVKCAGRRTDNCRPSMNGEWTHECPARRHFAAGKG
jgi:hypothetical protein